MTPGATGATANVDYGMNTVYRSGGDAFTPPNGFYSQSLAAVQAPATTFWIGESNNSYEITFDVASAADALPSIVTTASPPYLGGGASQRVVGRHLETTNVLYVDGHVKSVKLDALRATRTISGNQIMTAFTVEDD